MTDLERCLTEIAVVESDLRKGHPDVEGLCRALVDWSEELRRIERELDVQPTAPPGPTE